MGSSTYATVGNYQEQPNQLFNQGLFETVAIDTNAPNNGARHRLGTRRTLDDGRSFLYCSNTAAQLAAGILISKAITAQAATIAALDAAQNLAGAKKLYFTATGSPTLNMYQDGYLVLTAGTGIGTMYKIRGNSADDNPASGRFTVFTYDALETTMVAASTTADIFPNQCSSLLINPAVANGDAITQELVIGATTRIIPASSYFWAQTRGLGALICDVDAAAGDEANEMLITGGTTAGRGAILAAPIPGLQVVATTVQQIDGTDAEALLVNFCIS